MSSLEMVGSARVTGETVVAILSPASAQGKVEDGRGGKASNNRRRSEKEGWNKKNMGSDYGSAEQAPGPGIVGNQAEQNGKITGCGVDARGKWASGGLA